MDILKYSNILFVQIYEKNSTIELPLKQGSPSVKVNGLKPYTRYKVRLRVRIERKDNLDCTSYSRPAYITVVTKQAGEKPFFSLQVVINFLLITYCICK